MVVGITRSCVLSSFTQSTSLPWNRGRRMGRRVGGHKGEGRSAIS